MQLLDDHQYDDDLLQFPTWRNFPIFVMSLELEMLERFHLPPFAGSMFRGILGWALREVCPPDVYAYLFETTSGVLGQQDAVRPFVLTPPARQRQLKKGSRFAFDLTLLGGACQHLPEFIEAVIAAGRYGMGSTRAPFDLVKIVVKEGPTTWVCYDRCAGWRQSYQPLPSALGNVSPELNHLPIEQLKLEFLTPTRLVHQGNPVLQPDFHVILRALYRRLDALLQHHAGLALDVDFANDIREAESIRLVDMGVEWVDWERTSNRQQSRHTMGGLVGRATYRGNFRPHWLELLPTAQVLHLGKATTFGMGLIQVQMTGGRTAAPPRER